MRTLLGLCLIGAITIAADANADEPAVKRGTENLVIVTTDGLRPEEVFRGAEDLLLNKENGGIENLERTRRLYGFETIEKRREALLPFFWKTIAREGRIFGEKAKGSFAVVSNKRNFSYPGYSEMFVGFADDRIVSNAKKINPNGNVLEWLDTREQYRGRIAVYSSWDVLPEILRAPANGLAVNAGWETISSEDPTEIEKRLNRLIREGPRRWRDCRDDEITFPAALEYLKIRKPKVLYICLGDTDEHAHAGRYDLYLDAAREFDRSVETIWSVVQTSPEYRGKTTLIVTTDHGRGSGTQGWRHHGANVPGAEDWWAGILGPDTPSIGSRTNAPRVVQAQIAATIAAALDQDYNAFEPRAAQPLPDVFRRADKR